ncbi:MAG: carbamoyl phosphate synthase small subunit [Oscillospiraceae bacterium]
MQKAYLILENGKKYEGTSFGASGTSVGELVFTTGMTGCAESLTDPSYYGQLVIFTFPQFGNYGIADADMESSGIHVRGAVVREFCDAPSNFRCDETVNDFLKRHNVVGISGVDTRELTQMIRERGVINAVITTENPDYPVDALKAFRITDSVKNTSTKECITLMPEGPARHTVALMDYGAKKSIADNLVKRGCKVVVFPYSATAEEVMSIKPDGIMLSNGPGDPSDNVEAIAELRKLFGKAPMFGICLGHQMMALAAGAATEKLKFGHRGANQPVKDLKTGRVYITCQNHGYAVTCESLEGIGAELRYINVNDKTCEGVDYPLLDAFSMQFHPEAHGGPRDCEGAFDRFLKMMEVR